MKRNVLIRYIQRVVNSQMSSLNSIIQNPLMQVLPFLIMADVIQSN
jgi:hypothetical protein